MHANTAVFCTGREREFLRFGDTIKGKSFTNALAQFVLKFLFFAPTSSTFPKLSKDLVFSCTLMEQITWLFCFTHTYMKDHNRFCCNCLIEAHEYVRNIKERQLGKGLKVFSTLGKTLPPPPKFCTNSETEKWWSNFCCMLTYKLILQSERGFTL